MKINQIEMPKGANRRIKRRGRGTGSGHGKTSGKGHKGLLSRSGGHGGPRLGFEGGQMPLARRIPKRGFNSKFKKQFQIVNLNSLNKFSESAVVTKEALFNKNIIKDKDAALKILGTGELKKPLTIKADNFSKSAIKKIEKAGGKFELLKAQYPPKADPPTAETQ